MGYDAPLDLRDGANGRWVGRHAPSSLDLTGLFAAILQDGPIPETPDEVLARLPSQFKLHRVLGPQAIALEVKDAPDDLRVALKVVPPSRKGVVDDVLHVADGSRARRAHVMAHRVRAFGVGAPRPLGYLERARRPRAAESLAVTAFVAAPNLLQWWQEDLLPQRLASPPRFLADKRRRLFELADLVRTLHAQGLLHGDLHAENLLVTEDGLELLDLESIQALGRAGRLIPKTLARLNRDFLDLETLTVRDRMRWLAHYTRHEAEARLRRRRLWQDVEARTLERLAARGQAFGPSSG